jgi:hypothetical protein
MFTAFWLGNLTAKCDLRDGTTNAKVDFKREVNSQIVIRFCVQTGSGIHPAPSLLGTAAVGISRADHAIHSVRKIWH